MKSTYKITPTNGNLKFKPYKRPIKDTGWSGLQLIIPKLKPLYKLI